MQSLKSALISRLPDPVADRLRSVKNSLILNQMDEADVIGCVESNRPSPRHSVLVDVGAHHGDVTDLFLKKGWSAVAYEPDPANREHMRQRFGTNPRLQISPAAVSDKPATAVPLFSSPVSTGISSLSAFHESHKATAVVDVVTLAEDLRTRGVEGVEFLKVDVEGFDLFALRGFDWARKPRFVLYEFEDRKTVPLGYTVADSVAFVRTHGYHPIYSVWEPILEYGTRHRWRGLFREPPFDVANCWGNVMCFHNEDDAEFCLARSRRRLKLFGRFV